MTTFTVSWEQSLFYFSAYGPVWGSFFVDWSIVFIGTILGHMQLFDHFYSNFFGRQSDFKNAISRWVFFFIAVHRAG